MRIIRYPTSLFGERSVGDIGVTEVRDFIRHQQPEVVRWENRPGFHDTERFSPSTIHGYVRAIKRLWSWLLEERYITENLMVRLRLPKVSRKAIDTFSVEQIERMLSVVNRKSRRGPTHYLILLVLLDTGIRVSELVKS